MVPIIIGASGTVSKYIEKWLPATGVTCRLESLQRAYTVILGIARILCKVLDTQGHGSDSMFKEDSSKPSRSCV